MKTETVWIRTGDDPATPLLTAVVDLDSAETVRGTDIYVRLSARMPEQDDVTAAIKAGAAGILLENVSGGADLQQMHVMLGVAEAICSRPDENVKILAMPGDNPAGLLRLAELPGKTPRLSAVGWDRHALAEACWQAQRTDASLSDLERNARASILLAAAACGVQAVEAGYGSPDAGLQEQRLIDAYADGFRGAIVCSGQQLDAARRVFSVQP